MNSGNEPSAAPRPEREDSIVELARKFLHDEIIELKKRIKKIKKGGGKRLETEDFDDLRALIESARLSLVLRDFRLEEGEIHPECLPDISTERAALKRILSWEPIGSDTRVRMSQAPPFSFLERLIIKLRSLPLLRDLVALKEL